MCRAQRLPPPHPGASHRTPPRSRPSTLGQRTASRLPAAPEQEKLLDARLAEAEANPVGGLTREEATARLCHRGRLSAQSARLPAPPARASIHPWTLGGPHEGRGDR